MEVLYVEHRANKEVMIHSNSQLLPEARADNGGGGDDTRNRTSNKYTCSKLNCCLLTLSYAGAASLSE